VFKSLETTTPSRDALLIGLGKLKNAALFLLLPVILVLIGVSIIITGLLTGRSLAVITAGIASVLIVVFLGLLLKLIAVYGYLIPAYSSFREYDPAKFETPAKLVKIGYVAGLLIMIIGVALMVTGALSKTPASLMTGIAITIIGTIFYIIGYIGLIIGMFRLKELTNEGKFEIAGIFFILGLFIAILQLIGWVLTYLGAKNAINKLSQTPIDKSTVATETEETPPIP